MSDRALTVCVFVAVTLGQAKAPDVSPQDRPAAPPQTQPDSPVATCKTVGSVSYSAEHTWRGTVEINADNITLQDGTITAQATGVPQGVTFAGDRNGVTLRRLTFDGVGDGLNLGNDQSANDVTIDDCKFLNCRTPDDTSSDALLGSRGYGIFASGGENWTIRKTIFKTRAKDSAHPDDHACSAQYAGRFGSVHGLNVSDSQFESRAGKACVWLMFVRDAVFDHTEFNGGSIRIGARPGDMADIDNGDCRNIVFRKCTFNFDVIDDWPASISIFPGCDSITLQDCDIRSPSGCDWWIEIDSRSTSNITWKNCRWNGKAVEQYLGVRTSMSPGDMKSKGIGPAGEVAPYAPPG